MIRPRHLPIAQMLAAVLTSLLPAPATAQPLFTDAFPKEEFAARRQAVMAEIGDGVAVLSGATELPSYAPFRQNNQVFYLTGIEVPRAIVMIDGRSRTTTAFLPPRNERLERSEGPVLVPGPEAQQLSGIERVVSRDAFAAMLADVADEGRPLYVPFRPEALGAATEGQVKAHAAASFSDPWDGRVSKEVAFMSRIRNAHPAIELRNLDPIVDALRLIKSPREIALVREATRLACEGILAGMRAAAVGKREYEVAAAADQVFRAGGAQGNAYFALVATGANAHYPHYHALSAPMADGDLVLFDYAPDYRYYTSDVTRMFPATGRFTAAQRELYTVYLRLYQALLTSIAPRKTPSVIVKEAVVKMEAYLASASIGDPKVKAAAERFVGRYREHRGGMFGHWVGMEVHDVDAPFETLQPGMIFTIEPALTIPDDKVYVRIEDVILITEAGYENLSASLPVEPDALERALRPAR